MDVRVTGRGDNKNHVFCKYLENYSISIVFLDFFFVLEKARVVGPLGPLGPPGLGAPGALGSYGP